MFGSIVCKYQDAPKRIGEKVLNRLKIIGKYASVDVRETTVCGMLLYQCVVTMPYGMSKSQSILTFEKVAKQLYRLGVKRAAVSEDFPFDEVLARTGIRCADTSIVYRAMYLPMVKKLANAMDIPIKESHVLVYTHTASREVYSFCERVANLARYVTVIGSQVVSDIQAQLLNQYGIAQCPPLEDGSYHGDILVCFDEPDMRYVPHIAVQGMLCVPNGNAPQSAQSFVRVNHADFFSRKYEPFCCGDKHIDKDIISFLFSGGFLRSKEIQVDKLLWNGKKIEEK